MKDMAEYEQERLRLEARIAVVMAEKEQLEKLLRLRDDEAPVGHRRCGHWDETQCTVLAEGEEGALPAGWAERTYSCGDGVDKVFCPTHAGEAEAHREKCSHCSL